MLRSVALFQRHGGRFNSVTLTERTGVTKGLKAKTIAAWPCARVHQQMLCPKIVSFGIILILHMLNYFNN